MKATFRQLEAFFQIVRHQGIAHAARACKLDPSTLSEHLRALEEALETPLVERQPFRVNRHGRRLFAAFERAHELIAAAIEEISADTRPLLQFIAAEVVTFHYLPGITQELERRHPNLQCSTESGTEERMQAMLRDGEVNFAIAPEHDGWNGFASARLIELPLVLIAPKACRVKEAAELWARGDIADVLFVSGSADSVVRHFNAGLGGLRVKWANRRRVSSALAVTQQVAAGGGFGLTVDVPNLVRHADLRVIPLPKFPPVVIAAYWRGAATPIHASALELLRVVARELQGPVRPKPGR